ncbi:hypothetical protein Vretifemale_15992, partial [Volvox reticuliferus]
SCYLCPSIRNHRPSTAEFYDYNHQAPTPYLPLPLLHLPLQIRSPSLTGIEIVSCRRQLGLQGSSQTGGKTLPLSSLSAVIRGICGGVKKINARVLDSKNQAWGNAGMHGEGEACPSFGVKQL